MKRFYRGLGAALLLLWAVGPAGAGGSGSGAGRVSVYNWGDNEGGALFHVEKEGDVRFTADDSDVRSLTANGLLHIQETRDGQVTVFSVRRQGEAPALQRSFSVDGQTKSAEEARAWLARTLPTVLRRTGLGAADRVSRLHERGGVDAVLAEIQSLHSDWPKVLYAQALVSHGALSTVELQHVLATVTESVSGGLARTDFLQHTAGTFLAAGPDLVKPFFEQVIRVPSEYRGDLLARIAQEKSFDDPEVRAAYRDALRQADELETSGKKKAAAKGVR